MGIDVHSIAYVSFIQNKFIQPCSKGRKKFFINEQEWLNCSSSTSIKEFLVDVINYRNDLNLSNLRDYNAVVLGGSESSVVGCDPTWLRKVRNEIQELDNLKVPILGICYGYQLLASVFGCEVVRMDSVRFGVDNFRLTNDGESSALFNGCTGIFNAYVSHRDRVSNLSSDITKIIVNERNEHYGISIGDHMHGFQFHPEIPRVVMLALFEDKCQHFTQEDRGRIRKSIDSMSNGLCMQDILINLVSIWVG